MKKVIRLRAGRRACATCFGANGEQDSEVIGETIMFLLFSVKLKRQVECKIIRRIL